jgi:hypothetical protein
MMQMEKENGWVYAGSDSKGKPKFRKYTGQTIEHVKEYLDNKGIAYYVHERDKEPSSRYSSRYSYYYTTGRWGSDKRKKHYHSDGIEHFMETYYRTAEEEKSYWDKLNKEKDDAGHIC